MLQEELMLSKICDAVKKDSLAVIKESEKQYADKIDSFCNGVLSQASARRILLLAGPSGSGKTTTAHRIGEVLKKYGRNAVIVSMDNFYVDRDASPKFPDGSYDYESVHALDLPLMKKVFKQFYETGHCKMPIFDFLHGVRSPYTQDISLNQDDIIILEGLHALNPIITDYLPENTVIKLYVSVATCITNDDGGIIINKKDIRLLRRLVRDDKFRDFDVNETFDLWTKVVYGEKKYLVPFKSSADVQINSFHPYELSALAGESVALLNLVQPSSTHYKKAQSLVKELKKIPVIPKHLVPDNSLLREFLGH